MKYKISHVTNYDYDAPVAVCHNIVYLAPRKLTYQDCYYQRLSVTPAPNVTTQSHDYFGNVVQRFSLSTSHRLLKIAATSSVEITARELPAKTTPWEDVRNQLKLDKSISGLDNYQFVFASPRVQSHANMADYARVSFTEKRQILDAVADLNTRINKDFVYDTKATTVNTPIDEVFEHRRGVCQDLAHVMLGCLRSLGLAARYVSGYLRTIPADGEPRLVGADASHAWVSVYCGDAGWVDMDPTNDQFVQTDHITLAWGRDFSDVCPVVGMFVGGGNHQLSVEVDVAMQ